MGDLRIDQHYDAQTSYQCTLRIALVRMVAGALVVEH